MKRTAAAGLLCAALTAQASGFHFGDNGAKAMANGGAFAGQADDLTATQYNPAGLTQLRGLSFLADLQPMWHKVTFRRFDPGDVAPPDRVNTVTSSATPGDPNAPFVVPYFALGYGLPLGPRTLSLAFSVFGPPSQGAYYYPEPNYTKNADGAFVEDPRIYSPQRYALINTDIVIGFPSLSAAVDVATWGRGGAFSLGASLQLTVSHFKQEQVLYGGDVLGNNPQSQMAEISTDPNNGRQESYDARVGIDLPGQLGVTANFGAMVKVNEWLQFGASFRPPIPFQARGPVSVQLPQFFTETADARVEGTRECGPNGDQLCARLNLTLPLDVRIGVHVKPVRHVCALGDSTRLDCGLSVNADFVYQGWDSVDKLTVTPENVEVVANLGGETRVPINAFSLNKNWVQAYSGRFGVTYRIFQYLSASAGFLYETGASPDSSFSVDWTHPERFFVTGGLTGHLGPIDVVIGMSGTPTQEKYINNSQLLRGQTIPEDDPNYQGSLAVGNGQYTSGGFSLLLGIRGNFGMLVPDPPLLIEPSTEPTPVETEMETQPVESAPVEAAPEEPAPAPEEAPVETPVEGEPENG